MSIKSRGFDVRMLCPYPASNTQKPGFLDAQKPGFFKKPGFLMSVGASFTKKTLLGLKSCVIIALLLSHWNIVDYRQEEFEGMTQTTVKLQITFESLVEAIASLGLEEKRQLWQLLDREIQQTESDSDRLFSS